MEWKFYADQVFCFLSGDFSVFKGLWKPTETWQILQWEKFKDGIRGQKCVKLPENLV